MNAQVTRAAAIARPAVAFAGDKQKLKEGVAPYSHGEGDWRYEERIATRGDETCRQALRDVQREVLLRRADMLARMVEQAEGGDTFELFGADLMLETAVLDLPFAFWSYQEESLCLSIPTAMATDDEVWDFLLEVSPPKPDEGLLRSEPYYWQAATQLGGVASDESAVADLLMFPGANVPRTFIVPGPGKEPGPYDPSATQDVADWLASEGERMMFIYGENDPWTAGAFELGGAADSHLFIAPGGNHGSLISLLSDADRSAALAAIAAWTGTQARSRGMLRAASIRETLHQFGW